ncbi:TerB family tellurite resistance protein [Mesorhizobium sp.]|uniref:tellurite resistance TerB family protein n=1 Tax=Mesorhizobium sp. TaxID=1871066 RepID=UPI00121DC1DE|nr:TerB family tellurite resistance protein [Mesorhizobium sp.]TIM05497.1 MAG: TerB family tellurite resistance protein [Mesorhizobium sp.]
METPGAKNIGLGLLWFLGGSVVTFLSYEVAPFGVYVVTSGAIIGGVIQFSVGLFQYFAYFVQTLADPILPTASPQLRALVRAMVATAKADGSIAEKESVLIHDMIWKTCGSDVPYYMIKDICSEVANEKKDIVDYLATRAKDFDTNVKELILRCCFMVVAADGQVAERELALLATMGTAMGIAEARTNEIMGDLVRSLAHPSADVSIEDSASKR